MHMRAYVIICLNTKVNTKVNTKCKFLHRVAWSYTDFHTMYALLDETTEPNIDLW